MAELRKGNRTKVLMAQFFIGEVANLSGPSTGTTKFAPHCDKHEFQPATNTHLLIQRGELVLHRLVGDAEPCGYGPVGAPLEEQRHDLPLASGQ